MDGLLYSFHQPINDETLVGFLFFLEQMILFITSYKIFEFLFKKILISFEIFEIADEILFCISLPTEVKKLLSC